MLFLSRRRHTASFLAIILFMLMPAVARAQGRVEGTVTVAASGAPLAGVQVYVQRLKRGTVTDDAGRYVLSELAPGTYHIEFSHLGYRKVVRSVRFTEAATRTVDVALAARTIEAAEVVVVADDPRHTAEIPLQVLSIDEADRLDHGRMSLWEDLDRLPGIARSSNGPGIERPYLRGLSAGRILLFTQNLPYAYQTWDPEAGLATDGNGTEQVDVIQGPATLRYGPGAMGGVIDLVPEYPAPVGHLRGSFTGMLASNSEALTSQLALKQSHRRWFWGARAGFDSHADYKAGGDYEPEGQPADVPEEEKGKVHNARYDHLQGHAFAGISRSWGSTRLTYQFLQHRNGIVEAEEEEGGNEESEREIAPPYHAIRDHLLTSDTQLQLGPGWLHGVLGLQRNEQQEFEPEDEVPPGEAGEAAVDLNLTTFHYRFDYQAPLQRGWSLATGLQGYLQHNASEGLEPFIPNADRRQAGAFGLLTWRNDDVVVEGGLRYDAVALDTSPAQGEEDAGSPGGEEAEIERTFGLVSGSLGGTYTAGPGRYLKLNVGVGNRAPDVAELTAAGLLREVRRFLIGDEALEAEHNVEADATLGWRFAGATLSAGGFYNRILHYTYLFATGALEEGFPVYAYRQGDADFWGGHAGLTLHPEALHGVRLFSRFDAVVAALNDDPGYDLPMIPAPHWLNGAEAGGMAVGPLHAIVVRAEVDTNLAQDRVPPWETPSDAYALVNVSINAQLAWGGNTVQLGLHALNVLDTQYVDHLSLLKPDGIPNVGRSFTLTARVPFGR